MFHSAKTRRCRPVFRSSSTYYYLPSIDFVLATAARSHDKHLQKHLYCEGKSTIIKLVDIWDMFSKPDMSVTNGNGEPAPEGAMSSPVQSRLASSSRVSIRSTMGSCSSPSFSTSSYDDKDWQMKTIDTRYDAPSAEDPNAIDVDYEEEEEEEYDDDDSESLFSSFMLHFPDEYEYDENEYEYDTVVYYDDDLSRRELEAPGVGVGGGSHGCTHRRRAFAAGIPATLGGHHHHQSKKDRQITVLLDSVKKMVAMLFKAVGLPDSATEGVEGTRRRRASFVGMPFLQRASTI